MPVSFDQTPQNFLASLLAKPAPAPFKLPPQQQAAPVPQAPPVTQATQPDTSAAIAQAGDALTKALAARQSYTPYTAQAVPLQTPPEPKTDPKRAIVDALAGLLTMRSAPKVAAGIGQNLGASEQEGKEKYAREYQAARDKQATGEQEEQTRERASQAQEHELDTSINLAETSQQHLIDARDREVKATAAANLASFRANAYAQSIILAHQDRVGKIDADAYNHAETIGVRNRAIAASLYNRQQSDATALSRAGIGASTALTIASQRNNLALGIESLKEQFATVQQDKRLAVTQSMNAAKAMLSSYDAVIKAAANPLATPQQKAAAAQLLTPDPKTNMTPYQSLIGQMKATTGVNIPESQDVQNLADIRSQVVGDVMSGIDPVGAYNAGVTGTPGGGVTINLNTAPGGDRSVGGAPSSPVGGGGALPVEPGNAVPGAPGGAPAQLAPAMQMFGAMYGLPPGLLEGVIERGEASPAGSTSKMGNKGVAQLSDALIHEYGITDPFNPLQSVGGGARYLATLYKQFKGNPVLTVAAYNAGPGAVMAAHGDLSKLPAETQAYVQRVLGAAVQPGGVGGQPPAAHPGQPGQAPPAPHPTQQVATPQQVAQGVVQLYDKAYAGTGFDAAWGAISQKMSAAGATPQDLKAAETALRQHVAQQQQKQQAAQQQQEKQAAVAQLAKAAGVAPGTPAYNNFMRRPDIQAFLAGKTQQAPAALPKPTPYQAPPQQGYPNPMPPGQFLH